MRSLIRTLIVTAVVALTSASTAAFAQAQPGKGKTVRYAQGDSLGGNYVAAQLVMKAIRALGYDVSLSTMNTTLFFQAAAQGDVDLATDVNFRSASPGFARSRSRRSSLEAA